MKNKSWIGIGVAALVIVGMFRMCSGGGTERAIERVLALDHQYSQAMSADTAQTEDPNQQLDAVAAQVFQYTTQAKSIDLSSVPKDFAAAYYGHVSAWEDMGTTIQRHPYIPSTMEGVVEGFIRGLLGDWTGGAFEKQQMFDDYGRQLQARDDEIKRTWREVETIAIRNGASIKTGE
ncbi:MAG: hypothetical protein M5U15_05185 [Kiritimatiellae bacterium]|nr:hypothetical protein [Kiritimatiellia bacterium]